MAEFLDFFQISAENNIKNTYWIWTIVMSQTCVIFTFSVRQRYVYAQTSTDTYLLLFCLRFNNEQKWLAHYSSHLQSSPLLHPGCGGKCENYRPCLVCYDTCGVCICMKNYYIVEQIWFKTQCFHHSKKKI